MGEPANHSHGFNPERGMALAEGHASVKVASSERTNASCKNGSIDFDLTLGR